MTNAEFAVKIFELQAAARRKNPLFAARFNKCIERILACQRPVDALTLKQMSGVSWIPKTVAPCLHRLAAGDPIEAIVEKHVSSRSPQYRSGNSPRLDRETGEWSGSWDNSVRAVEDD